MVEAVQRFMEGAPAIGTQMTAAERARLRSYEGIVPKTTDWRTLSGAHPEGDSPDVAAE
jgi:phthalate 4,5-dioxygenase oxygenase subunit